jgi:transketolase
VGIARFGESAPGPALMQHFGITADAVVAAVRASVTADALVD